MENQIKYFIILTMLTFFSCSNSDDLVPEGVLDKDDMIVVMAEIELTQALIKLKSSTIDTINERQLYNEVYIEYNISEEEFNNSLNHYCKDPALLKEMYGKVIENLTKKQSEQQRK
jgi:hypothetical protein